jgi:putative hemolysin
MVPSVADSVQPLSVAIDHLPIAAPWKRFVIPGNLHRVYSPGTAQGTPLEFVASMLRNLKASYRVSAADQQRIPKTGPVVLVANHPFGLLDGAVLLDLISKIRPDVKLLANSVLAALPELGDRLIFVNPFGNAASGNRRGVREVLQFLNDGGLLITFPSGEVSHLDWKQRAIVDPAWNQNIARFIRHTKAQALPVFVPGANSVAFQLMGVVHPQLRTARLLHEFVNKQSCTVEVRVGNPVSSVQLERLGTNQHVTEYLRSRTYILGARGLRNEPSAQRGRTLVPRFAKTPMAVSGAVDQMVREIAALHPAQRLIDSGDLTVYRACSTQIPHLLSEIGRVRELTFREVGEGTGRARDLDRFDEKYHQLFLWDRKAQRLAGGYRLARTSEILQADGIRGLYTSELFRIETGFFQKVGPAIELGRSFIHPDYQRQYAPLLMLWRGIGAFVNQHPDHPVLFGAVSISNDYQAASRKLIVDYLQAQESERELSRLVSARRPFRGKHRGSAGAALSVLLKDSDELSSITSDIEPDGKGIPVLLRQYLKLGGKLLGFNVDNAFSGTLDGLMLVDLRHTAASVRLRYLGKDGEVAFRVKHRMVGS